MKVKVAILLCLILILTAFVFYIPPEEGALLSRVENSFQASEGDAVKVSSLTDFKWDWVCYVSENTDANQIVQTVGSEEGFEYFFIQKHSPFYIGSFKFYRDGHLIKSYDFNTWGLRLSEGRLVPPSLVLGGARYSFLSTNAFEGNYCQPSNKAIFKKVTSYGASISTRRIIFSEEIES